MSHTPQRKHSPQALLPKTMQAMLWALIWSLVCTLPSPAQLWIGYGKITGEVLDKDEQPLPGVTVSAVLSSAPDVAPPAVTTSSRGRFVIPNLARGAWALRFEAEGYVTSEGRVFLDVEEGEPLQVVMRPLSEISPAFAETSNAVNGWLQRGNSLLRQGQAAEARGEYEKTLAVILPEGQPEILRAIARTYLEEKNYDAAVSILQRALVFGPEDQESRRFYLLLAEARSQSETATAWLRRLDLEGADALKPEVDLGNTSRSRGIPLRLDDDIPALPPEAGRPGRYRVAFQTRHPLSDLETVMDRLGYDREGVLAAEPDAGVFDLANESFEVYVPQSSEEGKKTEPFGLFVWVSPTPNGRPRPEHFELFDSHRILWVGANNAGNPRPIWDRIALALTAVNNTQELYDIDPKRIFVGGYSGGGRTASALAIHFPEIFRGALLAYGCDYYRQIEAPDRPGMVWPAAFAAPDRAHVKQLRQQHRLIFLTGEHDFNRLQTRTYERLYRQDGFRHTKYLEIPGANHYSGIPPSVMDEALRFLDR